MSGRAALLWRGATLATLFFYPLVSGLADEPFYFQWRLGDTLELVSTYGVLGLLLAMGLCAIEKIGHAHGRLAATLALFALPLGSFATHALRQLGVEPWLARLPGSFGVTSALLLALASGLLLGFAWLAVRQPERARGALSVAILVLSPLFVPSAISVARRSLDPVQVARSSPPPDPGKPGSRGDIHVLVFDELDYDFLYAEEAVDPGLPNLRRFAEQSDNYHDVLSPYHKTLLSMAQLIAGRPVDIVNARVSSRAFAVWGEGDTKHPVDFEEGNIFQAARGRGYRTAVVGWALPYCEMLPESLDDCRSFSTYNYSSVVDSFSPLAPIFTTFNLFPFQRPFGFLKSIGYSPHQRNLVSATYALATDALADPTPLFQLVHFSVPHDPFVFGLDGYDPAANPFLQNRENYLRQLRYVDGLFGRFLSELEGAERYAAATVIVLSDHAYRAVTDKTRWRRIPFLVKNPHQAQGRQIFPAAESRDLLKQILEAAP